ncbi:MAG: hypothetical protein JWN17_3011 [Frankiales bacterium]|nr:hypothetical protein [Frankiales bacterium]
MPSPAVLSLTAALVLAPLPLGLLAASGPAGPTAPLAAVGVAAVAPAPAASPAAPGSASPSPAPAPPTSGPTSLARTDAGSSSSSGSAAQRTADDRGSAALSRLHYPWRDLGYSVAFRPYSGGTLGTTNSRDHTVVVFVKDGQSEQSLRATIAHELGHALDFGHGSAQRHAEYRRVRGLAQSGDWYPRSGTSDYASDAGDWAEVFAVSLAGDGDYRSTRAPAPTPEQLRRLAPLFEVPAQPSASPTPTASASPSPSARPAERGRLLPL